MAENGAVMGVIDAVFVVVHGGEDGFGGVMGGGWVVGGGAVGPGGSQGEEGGGKSDL